MSHDHLSPSKFEIAIHAMLPVVLMLFIEMVLNQWMFSNAIFLSPYLLAFFITGLISLVVLLKGDICPGQRGRFVFVLLFGLVFAVGNFAYSIALTPKYVPLVVANVSAIFLFCLFWRLPQDEQLYRTILYCGLGVATVGALLYLLVYWIELPSLFNGLRANNFAQLQLGILFAGWLMMLARSRLDGFFKWLVKFALVAVLLNYIWVVWLLSIYLQQSAEISLLPFLSYFAIQFMVVALLAWLLLGKNGKNPTAWTAALMLSLCYPLMSM